MLGATPVSEGARSFWETDGELYAVAEREGTVYLGGSLVASTPQPPRRPG
jgi:hypothetical protein